MFYLKNDPKYPLNIEKTIITKYPIKDASIYIQTYGKKKVGFIQLATEDKVLNYLKQILYSKNANIIYIDSLKSLPENKDIDKVLKFLNIIGVRIFIKNLI